MILIFSDIHGNKEAARFIEKISRGCEESICCGDICGYGKDFKYCIDMFRDMGIKSVLGNHDYMVVNLEYDLRNIIDNVANPIRWTRSRIESGEREYLENLPIELETESGIFVRHTYGIDNYIRTEDECAPLLSKTQKKIIAIGHTHIHKVFNINDVKVINPGSISKGRGGEMPGYVLIDNGKIIHRTRGTEE